MNENDSTCLTAVVGGGAAGLMAAISAALVFKNESRPPAVQFPVILLEKADRVGRKLLATGNGRCNLSNRDQSADHYHGHDPEFISSVLDRFPLEKTISFFRGLGLLCRTEEDGRIYPFSLQASAVLDLLRRAADHLGVCTLTAFTASEIRFTIDHGISCLIYAADGRMVRARTVVAATGGLAAPAFGCDGSGFELLKRHGHVCSPLFPALVQIRTETDLVRGLAGIKFDGSARLRINGDPVRTESGEILFAEYGLSGPPVFDLSREISEALQSRPPRQVEIVLDFLPDMDHQALLSWLHERRQSDMDLPMADFLTGLVVKKLGQALLKRCLAQQLTLASPVSMLTDTELERLAEMLKELPLRVVGTLGWQHAQTTAGGLVTGDFDSSSLRSRFQPGLFAAGEILDVDGDCGGYNLQWAWSSGHLAGSGAMKTALGQEPGM